VRWRQALGLVLAVALVGGALLLRERGTADGADPLVGLRRAAAIEPCPTSLGPSLPDLTLPCLDGGPAVSVRGPGTGVPTLVNVWGSWCPPCVAEIPSLVALSDKAAGRLRIVGVSSEDPQDSALRFARQFRMHYPSVVDEDGRIMRAYKPGPPTTLFLDATGRLVYKHGGKFKDPAELERLVRDMLGIRL
jgi:thiol-disulfide isomerase/thioredoxin